MPLLRWSLALALSLPAAALAAEVAAAFDPAVEEAAPAAGPEHGKAATADASPVDPGVVEAELGYAPIFNRRGGAAGFDHADPGHVHGFTGTVTYGAAPDVDVKLSGGFASTYDAARARDGAPTRGAGATDATVGARWRFLRLSDAALELAVTGEVVLPIGARETATAAGLTQDYWSARGALVATKDLGPLTANAEVALAAPVSGDAGGLRSIAQVNAALGWQLTPWLQPELELNYGHQAALGPDAQVLAVTAGVVAPFGASSRVVAAVQQGVWGRHATQTTAGVVAFKTGL